MNDQITYEVLEESVKAGVRHFVMCSGSRNSSFVQALKIQKHVKVYYWFEERSGAFFAMGKSKLLTEPVAIVTTTGTAAAELLPAAMEAYYSGIPILLITADRPRKFRGTGAPQSAEQVGLFGPYVYFSQDIAMGEKCQLSKWNLNGPAHLNVCIEEPQKYPLKVHKELQISPLLSINRTKYSQVQEIELRDFLKASQNPLVIVSTLPQSARAGILRFLQHLEAPVILEGISGLREDLRLKNLGIKETEGIFEKANQYGYSIDGVLRIGGVPTQRLWRDLEDLEFKIGVCSISEQPFSGLSWCGTFIHTSLQDFFDNINLNKIPSKRLESSESWREADQCDYDSLLSLFQEESTAEPSLIHSLSKKIPVFSRVYLGNSLPIREWDMAATREEKSFQVCANRGVNGIDGQLSTFLGMSEPFAWEQDPVIPRENWAILGDLTMLYDLAGPWIISQLETKRIRIVVINNGGGKIFSRMYSDKEMLHSHSTDFRHFAKLWNLHYQKWESGELLQTILEPCFIEITPDDHATERFWEKLKKRSCSLLHRS